LEGTEEELTLIDFLKEVHSLSSYKNEVIAREECRRIERERDEKEERERSRTKRRKLYEELREEFEKEQV